MRYSQLNCVLQLGDHHQMQFDYCKIYPNNTLAKPKMRFPMISIFLGPNSEIWKLPKIRYVDKILFSFRVLAANRQHKHALQWHHNEPDGVSTHHPHDCLLNYLFRRRSKKPSKLRGTGFVGGIHRWPVNSPHKRPVTRKMSSFQDVIMMHTM